MQNITRREALTGAAAVVVLGNSTLSAKAADISLCQAIRENDELLAQMEELESWFGQMNKLSKRRDFTPTEATDYERLGEVYDGLSWQVSDLWTFIEDYQVQTANGLLTKMDFLNDRFDEGRELYFSLVKEVRRFV